MTRALWTGGALICLAGLLLYGFGTNNPNPIRWSVFALAASYVLAVWAWNGCNLPDDGISWAVLTFVGYAALSLSWSLDWREGILSLNQLAIMAVLFIAALHVEREYYVRAVSLFATVGIIEHLLISRLAPGIFGGLGNENFQAEYLVIIAPLACMTVVAWRHYAVRTLGVLAAVIALTHAIGFNVSDAKWAGLAGIGGLGVIALYFKRQYALAVAVTAAGSVGVLSIYYGVVSVYKSVWERFELVYDTLIVWLDRPVFGNGIGSFNFAYPFHQEAHSWFAPSHVVKSVHNYAGAAHNDFVQALAVFGVVGAVLIAVIGYLVFKSRHKDSAAWFGAASLFALFGTALVGFPMQNPSTAVLGVAAAALVANNAEMGLARLGFGLRGRSSYA